MIQDDDRFWRGAIARGMLWGMSADENGITSASLMQEHIMSLQVLPPAHSNGPGNAIGFGYYTYVMLLDDREARFVVTLHLTL